MAEMEERFISTASMMRFGEMEMRGVLVRTTSPIPEGEILPEHFVGVGMVTDDRQVAVILENGTDEEADQLLTEREAELREKLRMGDDDERSRDTAASIRVPSLCNCCAERAHGA